MGKKYYRWSDKPQTIFEIDVPTFFSQSKCADRRDVYALSDPSNNEYSQRCDHTHDASCSDCDRFEQLLDVMKASFADQYVVFHSEDEVCRYLV